MSRANAYVFAALDGSADGMTLREHYAGLAMQAILTGSVTRGCPLNEWLDQQFSVMVADALIAALSQAEQPK